MISYANVWISERVVALSCVVCRWHIQGGLPSGEVLSQNGFTFLTENVC